MLFSTYNDDTYERFHDTYIDTQLFAISELIAEADESGNAKEAEKLRAEYDALRARLIQPF